MRKGRGKSGKKPVSRVVQGQREALEREWFWAVLLDGDRRRIEQLQRMLRPAANDPFDLQVVVSPQQDQDAASPPVRPSQPDR